jgi:hypothetical protein
MKNQYGILALMFAAVAAWLSPLSAQAVPAFARQLGVACSTCHYQHFPLLNAFGRQFKASGFTMSGTSNIEADNFSLPANLNAAVFTNVRWQKSNGGKEVGQHTSNNGELILPGETSLFVGGRVSAYMGALVEGDLKAGGDPFLASIKLPFMYPVRGITLGVVPFSAGLGPAYAYETMNTGAVGNHLINLVVPAAVSAQQYVQAGPGTYAGYANDAEGIGFVAARSDFFVTYAKWSPNHLTVDTQGASAQPTSNYLRAAWTPVFGGWEFGLGAQYFGGQSTEVEGTGSVGPGGLETVRTKAYAVDAQAQGNVGEMPLGVYLAWAATPGTSLSGTEHENLYNENPNRKWAASIAAELGAFANGRGTIQLAYRTADNGAITHSKDNAVTVGVTYLPWYNVQLALLQTWYSGSAHSPDAPNLICPTEADPTRACGATIDASGSGKNLTSLNLAVGF